MSIADLRTFGAKRQRHADLRGDDSWAFRVLPDGASETLPRRGRSGAWRNGRCPGLTSESGARACATGCLAAGAG